MPDLIKVKYGKTGKSKKNNALGMREIQERAYDAPTAKYLVRKAPYKLRKLSLDSYFKTHTH